MMSKGGLVRGDEFWMFGGLETRSAAGILLSYNVIFWPNSRRRAK